VGGTGSGSCPVAGGGTSGAEPSGSLTTMLVMNVDMYCFFVLHIECVCRQVLKISRHLFCSFKINLHKYSE
jgi:hypothetical protein